MKEIITELEGAFNSGNTRVVISGGDPTVHPDLPKIIKKTKELGFKHVQIITNGRMLAYKKFAVALKKAGLDEVTFSLHSHIKEDFEEITRVNGSYNQALAGLLNAQSQGFIVSVDIVINKLNYKKLRETLQFYIKLGVSEFDLLYPIPFGGAWESRERLFFSPEKAQKYLRAAFALSKNKDLFIWTNRLPAQYLEGFEDLIQNPVKIHDEVRGMKFELVRYIEGRGQMSCKGLRCRYCFMQGFCSDLSELLKIKKIVGKNIAPCLEKKTIRKKKELVFNLNKDFTLEKFTDFYIKNRYFVKSLRCKKCKYNKICEGVWIEDVREHGFSILKPEA